MSTLTFDTLTSRWRLWGQLVAESGLRIGAGKDLGAAATDLPLLRDGNGDPYLPGSSFKGALRSGLERVLRGVNSPRLRACDPFEAPCAPSFHEEEGRRVPVQYDLAALEEKLCRTCQIFGSQHLAGRIYILDLRHREGGPAELRDGVGIDRDLGTAASGVKYNLEVLPPGSRFDFELMLENADDVQRALVWVGLDLVNAGEIRLGGLTSRGLGRVRLEVAGLSRADAGSLLLAEPEKRYSAKSWEDELAAARQRLAAVAAGEEGAEHAS